MNDDLMMLAVPAIIAELTVEELEPAASGPYLLKYRGVASVDYAISRNKNYYDADFNTRLIESTLSYMKGGEVVSVFSRHGKAVQTNSLAEGLPVGNVIDIYREGPKVKYVAGIVDTVEGTDVAKLIRAKVIRASSIRMGAHGLSSEPIVIEGQKYTRLLSGFVKGIDLADEAGIQGAGIETILEEAPKIYVAGASFGGVKMEWTDLTIDLIREHRPELLEEFQASVLEANPPADPDKELQDKLTELTEARDALQTRVTELEESSAGATAALEEQVTKLTLEEALLKSSQIGASREIYAALKEKAKTVEEIPTVLEEVRAAALNKYMVSRTTGGGETPHGGRVDPTPRATGAGTPDKGGVLESTLTDEQRRMLELAGYAPKTKE